MDNDGYLTPHGLNRWLQSVVDRTLLNNKDVFPDVKRSWRDPAKTLTITSSDDGLIINVDLVPVVQLSKYPGSVRYTPSLYDIPECKKTCFIVPKYPPNNKKLFRVSIPDAEKLLMENKGCVKMLIKIFKGIRDIENWKYLCSYYIKRVFLLELEKNPDPKFWEEKNLDMLCLLMLKQFITVLDEKFLCHIFFPNYNLLSDVPSPCTLSNWKGHLKTIEKWSKDNVPKLQEYFNRKDLALRKTLISTDFYNEDLFVINQKHNFPKTSSSSYLTTIWNGLTGWPLVGCLATCFISWLVTGWVKSM